MDELDLRVRRATYRRFVELGRANPFASRPPTSGSSSLGLTGPFWSLG